MLPPSLHSQVFLPPPPATKSEKTNTPTNSDPTKPTTKTCQDLSRRLLSDFNLLGKQEPPLKPVTFTLPKLTANSITSHFQILGKEQAEPYLGFAKRLASIKLPPMPTPTEWVTTSGWTKYSRDPGNGGGGAARLEKVDFPDTDALVFDIENMWEKSHFAIMAVAASEDAWFGWVSPELAYILAAGETPEIQHQRSESVVFKSLIPLGLSKDKPTVVVGHNVAYDRIRVLEEYNLDENSVGWIDTLSLHCSVSGLSSQQRASWMKYRKARKEMDDINNAPEDLISEQEKFELRPEVVDNIMSIKKNWMDVGAMNSLKHVAKLYLGQDISKDPRAIFESGNVMDVVKNFKSLMGYCATDVLVTHQVFSAVFPQFLEKCPHPVSFAGMLEMGRGFLPTSSAWDEYVKNAEAACVKELAFVENAFIQLAENALLLRDGEKWKQDPWLKRLDWEPASARGRIFPGYPQWYRDLWDSKQKGIKITSSMRVAPYLLNLTWRGYPLYHNKAHGWMYMVPLSDKYIETTKETQINLPTDPAAKGFDPQAIAESESHVFYKVPHKDGEDENCGNPLSKGYISAFENGILGSKYPAANEILHKKSMCSYWISARGRIAGQLVVTPGEPEHPGSQSFTSSDGDGVGKVILPQIVVMGTVTRRAVESTWLTAANAKKTRIGSELKTLIRAPKGCSFVGADVDSEELWICSLLGDAQFGIHGSTPIGFMTLQGSKGKGTDLHTVTGGIVNISRDVAKIFNYSRFYGAGAKHSTQLLMQHCPGIQKEEAAEKIKNLFKQTKGTKVRDVNGVYKNVWLGGSESFVFNELERIANSEIPKTPVLGCTIPNSLLPEYVDMEFATSRVNWVVQSSGVDYLHLLLVSMNYLFRRFKIKGRFMLSIHDEVRYMVSSEQADLAALALQISNLWTRAIFSSRVGIQDLPLNIAFFSAVDIDHCLRKEVDQTCVTPTNTTPLVNGRSASIYDTVEALEQQTGNADFSSFYGEELETVKRLQKDASFVVEGVDDGVEGWQNGPRDLKWLEVQMSKSLGAARRVLYRKEDAVDSAVKERKKPEKLSTSKKAVNVVDEASAGASVGSTKGKSRKQTTVDRVVEEDSIAIQTASQPVPSSQTEVGKTKNAKVGTKPGYKSYQKLSRADLDKE
ncbi:DNA polymerase family A-domain-containing protein [Obelidium mucronatum]|nr:DNA polymerase family A-domain-containing protein [Obelidium mucronatum]